eukprot:12667021-Alexandrium_andersonii.AAC.1
MAHLVVRDDGPRCSVALLGRAGVSAEPFLVARRFAEEHGRRTEAAWATACREEALGRLQPSA